MSVEKKVEPETEQVNPQPSNVVASSKSSAKKQTPSLSLDMPEEVEQDEGVTELLDESFSEVQLIKIWNKYFELKKDSIASFESNVLKKKPALKDGQVIELTIKNGIEINVLKKLEEDLTGYLRKELKNHKITITHIQEEQPQEEQLYTDMDKFNYMAKKNPDLLKLKERLGLDPEY
ncbi:MAG: hypothetical protein RJQ09_07135 [Cyclobacteriaceae bacterium]